MKAKIKEKCYLWCKEGSHDKVYGLFINDARQLIKVWGRRGKTLKYQVLDSISYGQYEQTKSEKIVKGYRELDPPRTRDELMVTHSINEVISEFVDDPSPQPMTPESTEPAGEKRMTLSEILQPEVKCVDNTGIEDFFEKGVTYLMIKVKGKMLIVEDMLGQPREVMKGRFERV